VHPTLTSNHSLTKPPPVGVRPRRVRHGHALVPRG
jgi:hypothetical protein